MVEASGLEQKLLDLVKIRASQINGCAYCIVMHTNDARKHGESDEWMHLLNAWDEVPAFSERERAALAWTEAVTRITDGHAPDQVYEPGCWVYRQKSYAWRPGFTVTVPQAWVWVSARYAWTPAGCGAVPPLSTKHRLWGRSSTGSWAQSAAWARTSATPEAWTGEVQGEPRWAPITYLGVRKLSSK